MKSSPSRAEALSAVPVPAPGVHVHVTEAGLVRIGYTPPMPAWFSRFIPSRFPLPTRTLELDAMGTFVWNRIDGSATVHDLARLVAERYSSHPSEAEQAVAAFIRQLGKRGILGLCAAPPRHF